MNATRQEIGSYRRMLVRLLEHFKNVRTVPVQFEPEVRQPVFVSVVQPKDGPCRHLNANLRPDNSWECARCGKPL